MAEQQAILEAAKNGKPERFEPDKHLTDLNPNGTAPRWYMEVKWRLVWLRAEHPQASITTELHTLTDNFAIVTAHISLPNGASATGIGTADKANSSKFSGRIVEKAETAAIGRACAALGYGTQHTGSEFEGGDLVDSPARGRGRPAEKKSAPAPRDKDPVAAARSAFWAEAATYGAKGDQQRLAYRYLGIPEEGEHPLTTGWLEPAKKLGLSEEEAYRVATKTLKAVMAEYGKQKRAGQEPAVARAAALAAVDPLGCLRHEAEQRRAPASPPTERSQPDDDRINSDGP